LFYCLFGTHHFAHYRRTCFSNVLQSNGAACCECGIKAIQQGVQLWLNCAGKQFVRHGNSVVFHHELHYCCCRSFFVCCRSGFPLFCGPGQVVGVRSAFRGIGFRRTRIRFAGVRITAGVRNRTAIGTGCTAAAVGAACENTDHHQGSKQYAQSFFLEREAKLLPVSTCSLFRTHFYINGFAIHPGGDVINHHTAAAYH
jgi:hypothetical protein